ncbi:MAG: hypothetical protein ACM3MK_01145 [Chitinophagales bacterium]
MFNMDEMEERVRDGFHFEQLMIPWAFMNGLFLGGLMLRKGRKYIEKGPRD